MLLALAGILVPLPVLSQTAVPPSMGEVIEVRVINVDVVVTDREGRPLRGLTREDFELYENGEKVDVSYFSRISEGRLDAEPPREEVRSPPTRTATTEASERRSPVTWAVFVDQTNLGPERRNQALRHLRTFLERAMLDGHDRALLANLDGQAFRIGRQMTEERRVILDELKALEKSRLHRSPTHVQTAMLKNELSRAVSSEGVAVAAETSRLTPEGAAEFAFIAHDIAGSITMLAEQEIHRTRKAMDATASLIDILGRMDGRVVLLYVGAGFNTIPALDLAELWRARFRHFVGEPFEPKPEEYHLKLAQELERLFDRLSATRITVYAFHPGGTADMPDAGDPGVAATFGEALGHRGPMMESSLSREMAVRTGGTQFRINPELGAQLAAIDRDLNDYYSLGYTPSGSPGRTRRVKVRVRKEGARVRHRLGVREYTPEDAADGAVVAELAKPATRAHLIQPVAVRRLEGASANPLGVRLEVEPPRREEFGDHRLLPFRFTVGLENLSFQPQEDAMRADFILHFALVGADGTMWPVESRSQSLQIRNRELGDPNGEMVYTWNVDLSPLKIPKEVPIAEGTLLSATVEDAGSGRRSVVTIPVPVR